MTPIKQTKIDFDNNYGNCFAAAVASILNMPLHAVPEFEDLMGMGNPLAWQLALYDWADLLGLKAECHYGKAPKGYAIAGGPSVHGVLHAVVVLDGEFVHDPHPSNAFIQSVMEYWTISKVEDIQAQRP